MLYEKEKINHPGWFNKCPWYNTAICSRLHGSLFDDFITHARTDRHNTLYFLVAHYKRQHAYEDDESSIGDRLIPKRVTTEALSAFCATLNFIEIFIKLVD